MKTSSVLLAMLLSVLGSSRAAASFRNCDDDQIGKITLAFLTAVPFLDDARKELTSIREGGDTSHFEKWFGYVDEERLANIEALTEGAAYNAIGKAVYQCGPSLACNDNDPSIKAWSEHGSAENDFYPMYVCNSFFGQDVNTEFQAGVLVHEYSHMFWTRDFGAGEWSIGEDYAVAALRLAQENPEQAVFVAYNFGFFVMDR